MLFNSYAFFCFFILVTTFYFLVPFRWRWLLLLVASCYFYMFFIPYYILILFFTIIIDYGAGIWLEKEQDKAKKKWILLLSIVANVGILAVFKYYNFFNENITTLFKSIGYSNPVPFLNIILPIGLSFHTFQAMSYTIEVYRGNYKAERHFGIYALYVMYYPQLVAGPIERPQNVLPQLHTEHKWNWNRVNAGLQLMLYGLFKKVVIADHLSVYVNQYYENYQTAQGWELMIAAVFFSFQIYCDFSGYSDIALGSSRIMGIELMKNFNKPYFAKGISDFWSRWHISLSTWFKDYVYIPLGGNRVKERIWIRNILIIFLLSGFWHGANWTFIVWGALHGLLTIAEIYFLKLNSKFHFLSKEWLRALLGRIFTFISVTIAWIFFRAETLSKALTILHKIGFELKVMAYQLVHLNWLTVIKSYYERTIDNGFNQAFIAIGLLLVFDKLLEPQKHGFKGAKQILSYSLFLILIVVFAKNSKEQFIYFQF